MTDDKKPRWRKKIPKLRELGDMPEGESGKPTASGKDKPARSKANRRHMRMRKGVGRNKKVAKAPSVKPKPQPASKPEQAEEQAKTADTPSVGKDTGSRVTAFKGRKIPSRNLKKPPTPTIPGLEIDGISPPEGPPKKPLTPAVTEPPGPDMPKKGLDREACKLALQKAEKLKHVMGDFKPLALKREYISSCVHCGESAYGLVDILENYSEKQAQVRARGSATEKTCLQSGSRHRSRREV